MSYSKHLDTYGVEDDMRVLRKCLELVEVLVRSANDLDGELGFEDLRFLLVTDESSDIKCARTRVFQEAFEDRAPSTLR